MARKINKDSETDNRTVSDECLACQLMPITGVFRGGPNRRPPPPTRQTLGHSTVYATILRKNYKKIFLSVKRFN